MTDRKSFVLAATMLLLGGLMAISISYAHGGEEHEDEENQAMQLADSAAGDSARMSLDSAYATINAGFKSLDRIFSKGCFDCHSDKTVYPWYHKLPLIKSMIDDDIKGARRHVDMSKGFPFSGHGTPPNDLAAIESEIEGGDMPPALYRLMHWSAKPNDAERDSIFQWIDSSLKILAAYGQTPTVEEHDMNED